MTLKEQDCCPTKTYHAPFLLIINVNVHLYRYAVYN